MFRYISHPLRAACAVAAIAAALPLAAHAAVPRHTITRTEQVLSAAGFQAVPANTPERQADMATLPAGRLIAQPNGDGFTYVLADPAGCACLYLGNAANYQAYQQLALDRNIARQNADAAGARYGSMNWDLWGPYDGLGWQRSSFPHGGQFGAHGGGRFERGGGAGQHRGPGQH